MKKAANHFGAKYDRIKSRVHGRGTQTKRYCTIELLSNEEEQGLIP
jgi:hypothetical protein